MNPGGWRRSRARGERCLAQAALPSRCCATKEPATQPIKPPKSAGVSDWKKYTPASHTADQTPPQSPKNKQTASACLIGHRWGFVAAATAVAALPCFSSAAAYRSPGGSDGIGLQCVGSHSTSTLAVDIQRPCCHCPACQPACSGQNRSSVRSGSLGAVSIG